MAVNSPPIVQVEGVYFSEERAMNAIKRNQEDPEISHFRGITYHVELE